MPRTHVPTPTRRRISDISLHHLKAANLHHELIHYRDSFGNFLSRACCSILFILFVILTLLACIIWFVIAFTWLMTHYHNAKLYQEWISRSRVEASTSLVRASVRHMESWLDAVSQESSTWLSTDAQAQQYINQMRNHFFHFNNLYDDKIPETYVFQIQYKESNGNVTGYRNVPPRFTTLESTSETFNTQDDNIYSFSYDPSSNDLILFRQVADPQEVFVTEPPPQDTHYQNALAAPPGDRSIIPKVAYLEGYPMLFLTLPLDGNRYIGITGNISAMIPYQDEEADSVGFVFNTIGDHYVLGANRGAPFLGDGELNPLQEVEFGPIKESMSDIDPRVSSYALLTPSIVHQANVNTMLSRMLVDIGDSVVDWIIVYHVSGSDYVVYPAAAIIFSIVILPFLLLFLVFVPIIVLHRWLLRPLSKIVNQIISVQTEAIDAIDIGHYSRLTEIRRLQLVLFDFVGFFVLYKGFIPVHVQNKLNEEYGLYSETDDDASEEVVPYEAGSDLHNLNSFRFSVPSSSVRSGLPAAAAGGVTALGADPSTPDTTRINMDNSNLVDPGTIRHDRSMSHNVLSRKNTTYSIGGSKRSLLSAASTVGASSAAGAAYGGNTAIDRARLFDIGLFATEGSILVVRIENLRALLNLKEPEIFVMQYGKLVAEIQYLLQTSRGAVTQFTIQQLIIVWTNQWKNHHVRACNFANLLQEKVEALNHTATAQGIPIEMNICMGIATGQLSTGNIGRDSMKTGAVVGDTCDTAVFLSKEAERMQVRTLMDHATYIKAGRQQYLSRPVALQMMIPLRTNPHLTSLRVPAYELGEKIEMSNQEWLYTLSTQQMLEQWDIYNAACDAMKGKDYELALEKFKSFAEQHPEDIPTIENMAFCEAKLAKEENLVINAVPYVLESDFLEKEASSGNLGSSHHPVEEAEEEANGGPNNGVSSNGEEIAGSDTSENSVVEDAANSAEQNEEVTSKQPNGEANDDNTAKSESSV